MDILNTLKSFKHIEPNKDYVKKSRILILNATHIGRPEKIFDVILKNVEMAASVGLAGILIFLIFGGFSAWKFLEPLHVAGLDPQGLRAEADAIDIQIKLTDLNYAAPQGQHGTTGESTPQVVGAPEKPQPENATPAESVKSAENASSSYLPIDEVLDKLTK